MKIKLAFAAATTLALVVSCGPSTDQVIETYPFCADQVAAVTCIEVSDPVAQTGWLISSDGTNQGPVNYWLDGTIERH